MKALVFLTDPGPVDPPPPDAPRLEQHLATTPMKVEELPDPHLLGDDWMVLRTRLTGICGSDSKQVLMDFEDAGDNPMTAFISFPQVLGHEVVADVVEVGPAVDDIEVGQRVVLNPWLSCGPRGIDPSCPECQQGSYSVLELLRRAPGPGHPHRQLVGCHRWLRRAPPRPPPHGLPGARRHVRRGRRAGRPVLGVAARHRPHPSPPGGRVVVYGAGALGTTATAILRALHPDVEVATIARFPAQVALAERLGATVFAPEPREQLLEELAAWSGATLRRPWEGLPVAYPGKVDVVYDTVGYPQTVEVGLRLLAHGGALVQLGVASPARFEWTPWYFKELRLIGSNAFGVETVEGVRRHAIEHYLDLAGSGRIDLTGMLTHTFRLDDWRDAFRTIVRQGDTGAVKVAFDFR